jgi:hypothetical protein
MSSPMIRRKAWGVAATLVVMLSAGGCTTGTTDEDSTPSTAGPAAQLPRGDDPVELDAAEFTADIDNTYWPMKPGTRWTYAEIDEGATVEVVVTVTTETRKVANGVTARVVRDSVTEDGELIEDTFDWYAQDSAGNVWYLGEDTAEFADGKIETRAGSFEAGVDGALPGIIMPARPEPGMAYRQEYYKGEAEDSGEVLSIDEQVEVPAGHYRNALLTKDMNALEPKVLEYKLYARGVGPVLTLDVSGGAGREELVDLKRVSRQAARAAGTAPLGQRYP